MASSSDKKPGSVAGVPSFFSDGSSFLGHVDNSGGSPEKNVSNVRGFFSDTPFDDIAPPPSTNSTATTAATILTAAPSIRKSGSSRSEASSSSKPKSRGKKSRSIIKKEKSSKAPVASRPTSMVVHDSSLPPRKKRVERKIGGSHIETT
jgi:hypothetical protein